MINLINKLSKFIEPFKKNYLKLINIIEIDSNIFCEFHEFLSTSGKLRRIKINEICNDINIQKSICPEDQFLIGNIYNAYTAKKLSFRLKIIDLQNKTVELENSEEIIIFHFNEILYESDFLLKLNQTDLIKIQNEIFYYLQCFKSNSGKNNCEMMSIESDKEFFKLILR